MATVPGKEVTVYKKPKSSIFKKAVKTIVKKGIKFAVNPLTIAVAAAPSVYRLGKAKKFKYSDVRQFNKRGRKIT